MTWLELWEHLLEEARITGEPGELWTYHKPSASFVLVARTMHPSFMGKVPPKVDPERDNG